MLGTGNKKEEETVPDLKGYIVAEGCVSVCVCVCVCVWWGGSDRTRTNPNFSVACHFTSQEFVPLHCQGVVYNLF